MGTAFLEMKVAIFIEGLKNVHALKICNSTSRVLA